MAGSTYTKYHGHCMQNSFLIIVFILLAIMIAPYIKNAREHIDSIELQKWQDIDLAPAGNMSVAIVVPIHPAKYGFAPGLFTQKADVFFVFTFREDQQAFEIKYPDKAYHSIVLDEHMDIDIIHKSLKRNSIVTFKKYFALTLLSNYTYAICIDADTKLLEHDDIYLACQHFCAQKKIVSYPTPGPYDKINRDCFDFMVERFGIDRGSLASKVDVQQYFWFNQLPIYDMKIARLFLEALMVSDLPSLVDSLTYHTFDYILYVYYLLYYHEYRLVTLSHEYQDFEHCVSYDKWKFVNDNVARLYWMFGRCLENSPAAQARKDIYVAYHLDR